ncbi:unnamed protein product [Peniophora sp. CBMAI 1063]|nr:unnamed protein product [Peniophora sp. CBMAI 1063]
MTWRTALAASRATRSFSTSTRAQFPRRIRPRELSLDEIEDWQPSKKAVVEGLLTKEDYRSFPKKGEQANTFSPDDVEEFQYDDTTSDGHRLLDQQRQVLYYFRLIEHEMPKLVAFRKPFVPPTSDRPMTVRSIDYGGESHPVTAKRVISVPVTYLPLRDANATHKLKVLAGVRWTSEPPKDAGFRYKEEGGEHGYIKISCEDFPEPSMNLKWASDALDRLVAEANDTSDPMTDVPLDTRHIDWKRAKRGIGIKNGDLAGGRKRTAEPPSLRDFPREWLPAHPRPAPVQS